MRELLASASSEFCLLGEIPAGTIRRFLMDILLKNVENFALSPKYILSTFQYVEFSRQ